jgi:NADH-quinone oxidoreductase subunit N
VLTPTHTEIIALAPELILTITAAMVLIIEAFLPGLRRHLSGLTMLAIAGAIWARLSLELPGAVWAGMLRIDQLTAFVDTYILIAAFFAVWMAGPFMRRTATECGEFYALILFATVGSMVMACSVNLLTIFLGLELLSIPLYVLNAFFRRYEVSVEAGLKYFVVGAFASGFVAYGMALLYGASASTNLVEIGRRVVEIGSLNPLTAVGFAMVFGGLAFKLALVPCHAWAPDVYQGSPTPVTAFLSVVPKGAALIVLLRMVQGMDLLQVSPRWVIAASIIAVASQTLGNVVAIVQRDIKRMLAYSGIAHMGYALVAVIVAGTDGGAAVLFYLAAYTVMNMGAFACVAQLSEREDRPHLISDLSGQGYNRPVAALALTISLFALSGIPPFIGFTAKFVVFRAAINEGFVWLAVIGVINSLISVFYYVRVIYVLYMRPLPDRQPDYSFYLPICASASVAALGTLLLGIYPTAILAAAQSAILSLAR